MMWNKNQTWKRTSIHFWALEQLQEATSSWYFCYTEWIFIIWSIYYLMNKKLALCNKVQHEQKSWKTCIISWWITVAEMVFLVNSVAWLMCHQLYYWHCSQISSWLLNNTINFTKNYLLVGEYTFFSSGHHALDPWLQLRIAVHE